MKVLIKYIIYTVFQKPLRFLLILLTICISGAAMLASACISDTMVKTTTDKWRYEYGYSDIVISSSMSSPSRSFDEFKIEQYGAYFAYAVKKISSCGSISDCSFVFHGYTLDTLREMLSLPFISELDPFPFIGNKIIVSKKYADENGVVVGDALTANLNGKKNQFIVCAVCPPNGQFAYEDNNYAAIIPYEKMQSMLGKLGKADTIYIGLKSGVSKSHMILRLSKLYEGYQVGETYSTDHIRLQTNRSAVPFIFMSVMLCLMAAYVIYVIFQNIVIERMPQMGIYRAIGAGKPGTNAVMLLESVAYGLMGGICSLGMGILILFFIARHLYSAEACGNISLSVSPRNIALTLLLCIGISIAGGYLSLKRYNNMPIIGLIKQTAGDCKRPAAVQSFAALALFLISMTVLLALKSINGLVIYVSLVVSTILSFLIASPYLYGKFTRLVKSMLAQARGIVKIVSLSIQNQRGFIIASTILSVIVATSIVIGAITYSNDEGGRLYFSRFHYDIEITAGDLTRGKMNTIAQLPGVSDVCANYYSAGTDVKGQSISIYRIHGIDTQKAAEFMDYNISSTYKNPIGQLDNGKNILLTDTLRNIYSVKENDEVTLKIFDFNGVYREIPYKIIGFFDDKYTKLGRYALISQQNFSVDFRAKQYSSIFVLTDGIDTALISIGSFFRDKHAQVTTIREMRDSAVEESSLIISAMQWISYLSAVTGILGMFFIMLLSFKNRAGELAVYGAMGLPRAGLSKMLFAEMLVSGVGGITVGAAIGGIISYIALPKLIFSLQIAMSIYFSIYTILKACLMGISICTVSGAVGVISYGRTTLMGGLRSE